MYLKQIKLREEIMNIHSLIVLLTQHSQKFLIFICLLIALTNITHFLVYSQYKTQINK